jgi:hypothetical protein
METLKKRDILQEVLIEYGYSGWFVIEPNKLDPINCIVFNPKEKKMGEVSIPDEWIDDPARHGAIGESLHLTIQKCSYDLSQAHVSYSCPAFELLRGDRR